MAAITFIVWLVVRPRLPEFRVDSASMSRFNVSNSLVTADWDVGFTVRNPNKKMSIFYDRIEATVLYRQEHLSETFLVPFKQGKKNQTTVRATFAAASRYVRDDDARAMTGDRTRRAVTFNVRLLAWVRFRAGFWRMREHLLRVYCKGVNVGFSGKAGAGSLSGGSRECDVDM